MRYAIVAILAAVAIEAVAADKTVSIPEGEVVSGRCVGVHDGDTMTLLVDTAAGKRQAKIRLDGIDAPELGQAFSVRSKEKLADLVFEKECSVESRGTDRYGRTVGRISVGEVDVNSAMLEAGLAWHYTKYDSRKSMASRQAAAQEKRAGLWADAKPIPPWEWRKMSKEERKATERVER